MYLFIHLIQLINYLYSFNKPFNNSFKLFYSFNDSFCSLNNSINSFSNL